LLFLECGAFPPLFSFGFQQTEVKKSGGKAPHSKKAAEKRRTPKKAKPVG